MSFSSELALIAGAENVQENVSFKELTTFQAGGPCRYLLSPADTETLAKLLAFLKAREIPVFILGRGSNLLVSSKGFPGVVISLRKHFSGVTVRGTEMEAGAGALMTAASREAQKHGLKGLEFMSGIPGTVGGGLVMNAGAYGAEIRDVLKSADLLFPDGSVRTLSKDELDLSYRRSAIPAMGAVALSARFVLTPGDPDEIAAYMDELNKRRREKQPLEYGSAGSAFKRPEGHFAGALIEGAGLKGFSVGDACVSEKHAGFIVNKGSATPEEIYAVIRHVIGVVKEKSGVTLEPEIRLLGEF